MIYSDSFAALPEPARQFIYKRLWEILSGEDKSKDFSNLSHSDRKAIREILDDTLRGWL